MVTEFYEDIFEKDPKQMLAVAKDSSGEVIFEETGDEMIDKWEKEIAQGLTPDLNEGLSQSTLSKLEKERDKSARVRHLANKVQNIDAKFNDPRYQSKFVRVKQEEVNLKTRLLGSKIPTGK